MALASTPAKVVYLANRHPRLNRAQFAERWRHHGRANGSGDPRIAEIAGLRYCLTESPGDLLPAASDEHDGVALLSLRGLASVPVIGAMLRDNEVAYADELRTFERPVHECALLVGSEVVVPGDEGAVVVLDLARRRQDARPGDLLKMLDATQADLAGDLGAGGLGRWIRNLTVAPAPRGYGYDVVHELWFESLDAVAGARGALEDWLDRTSSHVDRATSLVLVTTVIERMGRDRP